MKPEALPVWMNTYLPFTTTVWIWTLASVLTCYVIVYTLKKLKLASGNDTWLLVSLMMEQDDIETSQTKKNWGLRCFFFSFILGFFILRSSYRGALFSCLTIQVVPKPIGT